MFQKLFKMFKPKKTQAQFINVLGGGLNIPLGTLKRKKTFLKAF